jgi:hypothetical protein
MFDVFTEEIEVLIKDGLANLYWFKDDLRKVWLRAGVPATLCNQIGRLRDDLGKPLTKRLQMDRLYQELRTDDFSLRLRVSREFVRTLVEHTNFVPQDPRHRIEVAERAALKLKATIAAQNAEQERKERKRRDTAAAAKPTYEQSLSHIRESFNSANKLAPQQRGYALERIFVDLMRISGIDVEEPFSNKGEQIDGAIKHDGFYYIVELKWVADKLDPAQIGAFFYKVDGRFGARGIVIAMNGFTEGVLETLPKGKELKVLLLDGNHLAAVIFGHYTFRELLNHAIRYATIHTQIYCPHQIA